MVVESEQRRGVEETLRRLGSGRVRWLLRQAPELRLDLEWVREGMVGGGSAGESESPYGVYCSRVERVVVEWKRRSSRVYVIDDDLGHARHHLMKS